MAHGLIGSRVLEQDPGFLNVLNTTTSSHFRISRYYQADLHPETIGKGREFLDHPHRGMTTGQTGI